MGLLDDKTAIISGAGSGIGRTAAELFTSEGATVVAVDLDAAAAANTADDLGGVAVVGNVADPATWEAAVAAADERGGVDVAYLNAAAWSPLPLAVQEAGRMGVGRKGRPWDVDAALPSRVIERCRAAAHRTYG